MLTRKLCNPMATIARESLIPWRVLRRISVRLRLRLKPALLCSMAMRALARPVLCAFCDDVYSSLGSPFVLRFRFVVYIKFRESKVAVTDGHVPGRSSHRGKEPTGVNVWDRRCERSPQLSSLLMNILPFYVKNPSLLLENIYSPGERNCDGTKER